MQRLGMVVRGVEVHCLVLHHITITSIVIRPIGGQSCNFSHYQRLQ